MFRGFITRWPSGYSEKTIMEKDIDLQNERVLEGNWEDFDMFLAKNDYRNARALMDSVGENGWENDALRMHHLLNEAAKEIHYEPISQEKMPDITPEEDDAPEAGVHSDWHQEGDEKFPNPY